MFLNCIYTDEAVDVFVAVKSLIATVLSSELIFSDGVTPPTVLIFLTGCSTTKWEWLPEKNKDHHRAKYQEGIKVDVVKVSF